MKYSLTIAEAQKMIKKILEEKIGLIEQEQKSSLFNASLGEDVESVRPDYNFELTQAAIRKCDEKVRILKHAINKFNIEHYVDSEGMTVDQVLVRIPQLTEEKRRLQDMQGRLPKQRTSLTPNVVDYRYANYNIAEAKEEFESVSDRLRNLQTSLDTINTTERFEVEIPD